MVRPYVSSWNLTPHLETTMDEAEESEEMAALVALDEVKAKYGSMMSAAEYKRRKKAILASFSGQMFASAGPGYKARARFIWRDVPGMTNVKGKDFKEVRAKMKGDFKSDPDCRSGLLSNFKANKNCTFARRIAILDGKEKRYRMVVLNNGNFCFQVATDLTKTDSEEDADDDEEDEDDDDEDGAPAPPPAPAPAPKGGGKRKRAPEKPPAEAEDEAGPSTGGRPQRARKQATK